MSRASLNIQSIKVYPCPKVLRFGTQNLKVPKGLIFPVLGTLYFPCTRALFSLYWGLCISLYLDLIFPVLGTLCFSVLGPYFSGTGDFEFFLYWGLIFPVLRDFVFLCTGTLFSLYWGLSIFPVLETLNFSVLGPYFPCSGGLCISLY